jgi:hypothetical protein
MQQKPADRKIELLHQLTATKPTHATAAATRLRATILPRTDQMKTSRTIRPRSTRFSMKSIRLGRNCRPYREPVRSTKGDLSDQSQLVKTNKPYNNQ